MENQQLPQQLSLFVVEKRNSFFPVDDLQNVIFEFGEFRMDVELVNGEVGIRQPRNEVLFQIRSTEGPHHLVEELVELVVWRRKEGFREGGFRVDVARRRLGEFRSVARGKKAEVQNRSAGKGRL